MYTETDVKVFQITFNCFIKFPGEVAEEQEVNKSRKQSFKKQSSEKWFKIYVLNGEEIKGTGHFRNHPDMKAYLEGTVRGSVEEAELLKAILKS